MRWRKISYNGKKKILIRLGLVVRPFDIPHVRYQRHENKPREFYLTIKKEEVGPDEDEFNPLYVRLP